MVEVEKEKVEGEVRAELSTFWPKLKVTPAGAEDEDLFSSVGLLLKENRAGGGAEEEEEREEVVVAAVVMGVLLTSPLPVPYWRSMLLRWRS